MIMNIKLAMLNLSIVLIVANRKRIFKIFRQKIIRILRDYRNVLASYLGIARKLLLKK